MIKPMSKLKVTVYEYPNPTFKWAEIMLDRDEVGRCEVVEGGYKLRSGRKVLSLQQVAQAILRSRIKDADLQVQAGQAAKVTALKLLERLPPESP
jgi:hypothetical protein